MVNKKIWNRVISNKLALGSMIIVVIMILLAVFAPFLTPYSYAQTNLAEAYNKPSFAHIFGTDELGRDILSRILYGGRYSLSIGILSVMISLSLGGILGAIAGFYGGIVEELLMRACDVFQAFPSLLLAMVISAVLGPGFSKCVLALGLTSAPGFARMLRANILTVRENEYVEAARSINCSNRRIIMRHIVPNAIAPVVVMATMQVANSIICAASLSFVGLGIQAPAPEWGAMLSSARNYIRDYPHMVIFPGIAIMISVLALNIIGDALRDALDPKLKK